MAHPDRNGGDRKASRNNRLRNLASSPELGLGRISSQAFTDVDGSTIHAYVLPVPGTEVTIIVREDRIGRWHTNELHGYFEHAIGEERDRLTRTVRQLTVLPSQAYTDNEILNHLAVMTEDARNHYPSPLRDYTRRA